MNFSLSVTDVKSVRNSVRLTVVKKKKMLEFFILLIIIIISGFYIMISYLIKCALTVSLYNYLSN